jgi:L-lactate dehydrogenase complex protein LldE
MVDPNGLLQESRPPRVGLLVTCLADLFRPKLGFAAIQLLEASGCEVEAPLAQTCCGQPAFNAGAMKAAAHFAREMIKQFEQYDYVVAPSGSCAATIKVHYPEALADDPNWLPRAQAVAAKTWELLSFLAHVRKYRPAGVTLKATATYHDSCSGLRELGVYEEPRSLLAAVDGLELKPLPGQGACCGFGGTFSVKYPSISNAITEEKANSVEASQADLLLGGDLGCLMNIAGKLSRRGSKVRAMHAAEVLAGMSDTAIGEEE